MNWFKKMERKLGRYAIPNLMFYVIILYGLGFALSFFKPEFYMQYLALDAAAILQGQVWRILTFIIQPPNTNLLFVIFTLYLYYMIGRELEYVWGTFKFNVYFFTGVLLHVAAALLTFAITNVSLPLGTYYLNLSLFFAYATVYPNQQFYLFGILPVKAKYLALIDAVYFGWAILQAFLPSYGGNPAYGILYKANALAAFVSILNFLIFFLTTRRAKKYSAKEIRRKQNYKRQIREARRSQAVNAAGARHRCAVCGRTEQDDPTLEFRYCSKCNGNYEYCQEHLFTHEHIK